MKSKAQKSSKPIFQVTLKVNDLIIAYKPAYKNTIKEQYYKQASYYHRKQKGLVKVSKWAFDSERKKDIILEKSPLQIHSVKEHYLYDQNDDAEKRIFWVNFSDKFLFQYDETDYFGQSEKQSLEHPVLNLSEKYLSAKNNPDFETITENNNLPTPFIFENVPQWIKVEGDRLQEDFTIYQQDKKNNIIAMKAPSSGKGKYTEHQIRYLLITVLCAFSGACKQSYLSKRNSIVIHTGNWGCGNFGNNNELIYLAQIIGASAAGVSELYFHKVDETALNLAKEKYENMKEKQTLTELINYLMDFNFCWQADDVKELLTKMGLHYGMTAEEIAVWKQNQLLIKNIKNISLYDLFDSKLNITKASLNYCQTIGELVATDVCLKSSSSKDSKNLKIVYKKLENIGVKSIMTEEDWQKWGWENKGKDYLYFMNKLY